MSNFPRVLIVSNNAISDRMNNGKTIASVFKGYPSEKIYQLFFKDETPSGILLQSYFKMTDKNILDRFLRINKKADHPSKTIALNAESDSIFSKQKVAPNNITRILRELVWRNQWKTLELLNWLDKVQPEIIFFVAGDSGFAYDIVEFISKRYNSKLITYITDDYILPRKKESLLSKIRRKYIYKQMQNILKQTNIFLTISKKMSNIYEEIFDKKSSIAVNMTDSMKIDNYIIAKRNFFKIVYAGGLHLRRYETLQLLCSELKKYNLNNIDSPIKLFIYSTQLPEKDIQDSINDRETCFFEGSLNPEKLKLELNNADILLHVESFNINSIEATRLSVSTKIPEYLSLGKPVLAIGPKNIASMELLSNTAIVVNSREELLPKIDALVSSSNQFELFSEKSRILFNNIQSQNQNNKMINLVKSLI